MLRHLEDHIVSTDPNFMLFPASPTNTATDSGTAATSAGNSVTHSTGTLSSASAPHIAAATAAAAAAAAVSASAVGGSGHRNSWQAIAPPNSGGGGSSSSKSSDMIHLASWDSSNSRSKRNSAANVLTNGALLAAAGTHKASSNPATLNGGSVVEFQPSPGALIGATAVAGHRPSLSFEPVDHVGGGTGSGSSAGSDDHHISFSKNGTEIIDFDIDDTDKSNTQIGFDTFLSVPGAGAGALIDNVGAIKTRRSNSLTTAAAAGCRLGSIGAMGSAGVNSAGGLVGCGGGAGHNFGHGLAASIAGNAMGGGDVSSGPHSGSAQNLSHMLLQKPRSFSLSMASGRGAPLTSSGSDTRLDDFRTAMQLHSATAAAIAGDGRTDGVGGLGFGAGSAAIGTPSTMHHQFAALTTQSAATTSTVVHKVGMSNIGQWLKSLRLHKYVGLFSKITYEEMLAISEEYLQQLHVTKGARHKLVVCIQRLHERHALLGQLEKDLLAGRVQLAAALEELTGVVLTPMRPVEPFNKMDVGGQFLRVLNLGEKHVDQLELRNDLLKYARLSWSPVVSNMVINTQVAVLDEDHVNTLLWILEKAVHNEAFVAHTNQLKEHRYKVARIKAQFPPKPVHFATVTSPSGGGVSGTTPNTANTALVGLVPTPVPAATSTATPASVVAGAQNNNDAALSGNMSRSR